MSFRFLICGLGNSDERYLATRHNAGFMVMDALFNKFVNMGQSWKNKFLGLTVKTQIAGSDCLLLKPLTYMNRSGQSIQKAANYFSIETDQIIIIHDDLDFDFGTVRIKLGGGAGGHNGLLSAGSCLGDNNFTRVRIGIGKPEKISGSNFVLSNFSQNELEAMKKITVQAADAVELIVEKGPQKAMNSVNIRQQKDKGEE